MTSKLPIIQGGMGIGVSGWKLSSAVANAGGIGIISGAQSGYRENDFAKIRLNQICVHFVKKYEKLKKTLKESSV